VSRENSRSRDPAENAEAFPAEPLCGDILMTFPATRPYGLIAPSSGERCAVIDQLRIVQCRAVCDGDFARRYRDLTVG
jgi:hypothetical protein